MSTLQGLMREATRATTFRGHRMLTWVGTSNGRSAFRSCADCAAWVQVLTHPAANEIDIGGSAVALDCPVKE